MRFFSFGYWKVKAVQCYLSLLIWLILVSIGLYWFLNRKGTGLTNLTQSGFAYQDGTTDLDSKEITKKVLKDGETENPRRDVRKSSKDFNYRQIQKNDGGSENVVQRLCNKIPKIPKGDENAQIPDFKLEAIIIIIRHGDRGPLTHIGHRNVSHISCSAEGPDFEELSKFANDTLVKLPGYSQFIGHFQNFPKVPSTRYCSLGQLSQQGSAQLLALGKLVRSIYQTTLTNFSEHHDAQQFHKVLTYSTRYRRTFQSVFAFLYGLLGPSQLIQSTTIRESQSITFCFKHCSCKAVDRLKKTANKKFKPNQEGKAIMSQLVIKLNSVLGTEKSKKTGNSLLDSLLVYPCHGIELPCHQENQKATRVQLLLKSLSLYNHHISNHSLNCVTFEHLKNLVHFINEENNGLKQVPESQKFHLLNSYGLLKEIVNLALKMTSSLDGVPKHPPNQFSSASFTGFTNSNGFKSVYSGEKGRQGKIVVFSGHDTTIQSVTAALGLISSLDHADVNLPPFGSRLIFEFYKKTSTPLDSPRKLYFRVIYNGISVTHLVSFCKEITARSDTFKTSKEKESSFNKTTFCPIENLVRFIYENYFISFNNATNFRDACKIMQ